MATDGKPLNAVNCDALRKIIEFEKAHGKMLTAMYYNTLNFSADMTGLDGAYPSLFGHVSIDWMMRSGGGTPSSLLGASHLAYVIEKSSWNILSKAPPWTNIGGEANSNAPFAFNLWMLTEGMTLERMFSASIDECNALPSSKLIHPPIK